MQWRFAQANAVARQAVRPRTGCILPPAFARAQASSTRHLLRARFSIAFWMWVVMTGMTIPPVFQAHAWIVRRRIDHGAPYIPSLFLMTVWSLFSFVVAWACSGRVTATEHGA